VLVTSVFLAALAALVWGSGDFCGGKASQRVSPLPVTVVSQLAAVPTLVLLVLLFGGPLPGPADVAWSLAGGAAGFVGILLLYRGLSMGAMSLFAPISAVTAALVPVVVGLATDGLPAPAVLLGIACAVAAIGLISTAPGGAGRVSASTVRLALACGVMFGAFFALFGQVTPGSGAWPLVWLRVGSLGVGLLVLARGHQSLRISGTPLAWTVVAGSLDIAANGLYLASVLAGSMAVVAPIAALYPVSTVLLALAVDRERIRLIQVAGLGLAAAALVLTAT
jgi:drug/metabolite transporter (DMT)-like permease